MLLVGVVLAGCHCPVRSPFAAKLKKLDVHTHFSGESARRMVALMDQWGIDVAVNLSGGAPGQELSQEIDAARMFPGRILVFANLDWAEARQGDGYGARMSRQLDEAKRMGARGLKISKALGLAYRDATGKLIPVDDPELDPVFERAGQLGLPVAIHVGDPVAFWRAPTPDNERFAELKAHPRWSYFGREVPAWEELFSALERRIARHPGTTFISVHFGNAPEDPDRVARLLEKYPNLYVDTAARIPEIGRFSPERMKEIFTRFQDRILFGTDLGVGPEPAPLMLGSTGATPPTSADVERFFGATWRYFETADRAFLHPTPIQGDWTISGIALPREVLKKVYYDNAAKLLLTPRAPAAPGSRG